MTAYYVAFGPHGPRTPVSQPGDGLKIFLYTMALVGVAGLISLGVRARGMSIFSLAFLSLPAPLTARHERLTHSFRFSTTTTQDALPRMARSLQRARARAKFRSHHRYVFPLPPLPRRVLTPTARYRVRRLFRQRLCPELECRLPWRGLVSRCCCCCAL